MKGNNIFDKMAELDGGRISCEDRVDLSYLNIARWCALFDLPLIYKKVGKSLSET